MDSQTDIDSSKGHSELFIGIKADASLQEKAQTFLASRPEPAAGELRIELWLNDKTWYAGARLHSGITVEFIFEFASRIRHELIKAVPDTKLPETQFRIFYADPQVPAVIPGTLMEDGTIPEDESDGDNWP